MRWYVYLGDEVSDEPYSKEELAELDDFSSDTKVYDPDKDEWIDASDIGELTDLFKPSPPPDPSESSQKVNYCPKCGSRLTGVSDECENCGRSLTDTGTESSGKNNDRGRNKPSQSDHSQKKQNKQHKRASAEESNLAGTLGATGAFIGGVMLNPILVFVLSILGAIIGTIIDKAQ